MKKQRYIVMTSWRSGKPVMSTASWRGDRWSVDHKDVEVLDYVKDTPDLVVDRDTFREITTTGEGEVNSHEIPDVGVFRLVHQDDSTIVCAVNRGVGYAMVKVI